MGDTETQKVLEIYKPTKILPKPKKDNKQLQKLSLIESKLIQAV